MIPAALAQKGFVTAAKLRPAGKLRRLLIGCEGAADSGKTEFALSAPGVGMAVVMDRGIDPIFDNPTPPKTRNPDFGFRVISTPLATAGTQQEFLDAWKAYRGAAYDAAFDAAVRVVVLDGDSDSWETQRLAAFGKITQVPPHLYTEVNAARRAFYAKLWDSGKIIIATNKIKKLYSAVFDETSGKPKLGNDGKQVREWDGKSWERQGFDDQEYLWQIQLRHYHDSETGKFRVEITKCKANMGMVGQTLEGDECNFESLVQVCYPNVPLKEWGY